MRFKFIHFISFQEILVDPNIIKVGTAIDKDAENLYDDYNVCVKSTLDLRYIAREAGFPIIRDGLTTMSEKYLGISLDKSWEMRALNWNKPTLTTDQINYASKKTTADMKLFKFFGKKILFGRHIKGDAQQLKYIIENYCSKYLNRKYQ